MRYSNGTKNNVVTAIVRADGLDCPELGGSGAGSAGQCWIALKSGQTISVFCDIKLETSQYQVDLVVDGVLRNIVVSTVCPRNEDRAEIVEFYEGNHKHFRSLFRSPMVVSRLPDPKEGEDPVFYDDSDNTRVGTIEVLVYTYDQGYNHTRAAELPENVVDWEDLEGSAGCAGIQPTHEVVMPITKRLNDTERRTWKNKSEKLPMGHAPWAYFKYLYRHEASLQGAELIDRRLHIVPTVDELSNLRTELLSFASSQDGSSFGNNPWIARERNGLREYKQLDIIPDQPGPQIISTKRVPKRPRFSKKGKKQASRRSTRQDDDLDYDSADDLSEQGQNKRVKSNLAGLRAEVEELQLERNKARRIFEKQSNCEASESSSQEESLLLIAHKEALEREMNFMALEVSKYEAALQGESDAVESAMPVGSSDNAMMIDPALLTSGSLNSETSISSDYVTDGRVTRHSARIAAVEKATNSLVISNGILAVNNGLAMENFRRL